MRCPACRGDRCRCFADGTYRGRLQVHEYKAGITAACSRAMALGTFSVTFVVPFMEATASDNTATADLVKPFFEAVVRFLVERPGKVLQMRFIAACQATAEAMKPALESSITAAYKVRVQGGRANQ